MDPYRESSQEPQPDFWRSLAYRWFVEYNPLYLLSAALVLVGCSALSSAFARHTDIAPVLAVGGIAEVYAFALIGGAALLVRLGQKRPAVMLALLAALYQWDLTLHVETCAYLGWQGWVATAAWVAAFICKLQAIEWAFRVRLSAYAKAAAIAGALGLAVWPHLFPWVGAAASGRALAVWVFALGTLARCGDAIRSREELTDWGRVVLGRVTRAAWGLGALLLSMHVLLLSRDHDVDLKLMLPAIPLMFVRTARTEARAWLVFAVTELCVLALVPSALGIASLLGAAALTLRAMKQGASRPRIARATFVPLVTAYAPQIVHRVPLPHTAAQFGGSAIALGFVLLAASLAATYRLRARSASTASKSMGFTR